MVSLCFEWSWPSQWHHSIRAWHICPRNYWKLPLLCLWLVKKPFDFVIFMYLLNLIAIIRIPQAIHTGDLIKLAYRLNDSKYTNSSSSLEFFLDELAYMLSFILYATSIKSPICIACGLGISTLETTPVMSLIGQTTSRQNWGYVFLNKNETRQAKWADVSKWCFKYWLKKNIIYKK